MAVRWVLNRTEIKRLDNPVMDTLLDIADERVDAMKVIAPVDDGDMRETIRVTNVSRAKLRVRITAGGMLGPVTGKPVDYPHFVERGTSKMAAQPFMRPALYGGGA